MKLEALISTLLLSVACAGTPKNPKPPEINYECGEYEVIMQPMVGYGYGLKVGVRF